MNIIDPTIFEKINLPSDIWNIIKNYLYLDINDENIHLAVYMWYKNKDRALNLYGHISYWDTCKVTNMSHLFYKLYLFNDDITNWNVSNVKNMSHMFCNANSFNQPIGNWDVSNVENMSYMFSKYLIYDHIIRKERFYWKTKIFNQPVSWGIDIIEDTRNILSNTYAFNQSISDWQVGNVKNMSYMFMGARDFNQPIGNWNVANVVNMIKMFKNAKSFNQSINNWNVVNVENMSWMFYGATSFNQPINNWNVLMLKNMYQMFYCATSFNQSINDWLNVINDENMKRHFKVHSPTFNYTELKNF
jgi:surface protein